MNQKRYWLRGGAVGVMIDIAVVLFLSMQDGCIGGTGCGSYLSGIIYHEPTARYRLFAFLVLLIIITSLLGWLFGKYKHRLVR